MSLAVVTGSPRTCSGDAYSGVSISSPVWASSSAGDLVLRQQLRDTEVQELHLAVGGHEDVAGLEVAMHHQVLVGVMDRLADGAEEAQPLGDRQPALVAVPVDRGARHVLHGEVREAQLGDAGVEQAGDVGVLEAGEDPALEEEAPHPVARGETAFADQLEGDPLLDVLVARRERPPPCPRRRARGGPGRARCAPRRPAGRGGRLPVAGTARRCGPGRAGEEVAHPTAEIGIGPTGLVQERRATLRRQLERGVEQLLDAGAPPGRIGGRPATGRERTRRGIPHGEGRRWIRCRARDRHRGNAEC